MDRLTRFKILRALWARARTLLARLAGPHDREAHVRAQRWQQIQVAERQLRDGIARSTGDPDSYVRPQGADRNGADVQAWQAQQEAQRQWYAAQQRRALEARQRHGQPRRGR
jgi:hypothetical protein